MSSGQPEVKDPKKKNGTPRQLLSILPPEVIQDTIMSFLDKKGGEQHHFAQALGQKVYCTSEARVSNLLHKLTDVGELLRQMRIGFRLSHEEEEKQTYKYHAVSGNDMLVYGGILVSLKFIENPEENARVKDTLIKLRASNELKLEEHVFNVLMGKVSILCMSLYETVNQVALVNSFTEEAAGLVIYHPEYHPEIYDTVNFAFSLTKKTEIEILDTLEKIWRSTCKRLVNSIFAEATTQGSYPVIKDLVSALTKIMSDSSATDFEKHTIGMLMINAVETLKQKYLKLLDDKKANQTILEEIENRLKLLAAKDSPFNKFAVKALRDLGITLSSNATDVTVVSANVDESASTSSVTTSKAKAISSSSSAT